MTACAGYAVTGGLMGIGVAATRALCQAGARAIARDVPDRPAVKRVFNDIAKTQAGLDGPVDNAGVEPDRLPDGTDADGQGRMLDVNLKDTLNCVTAAARIRADGSRAIVILANRAGALPDTCRE